MNKNDNKENSEKENSEKESEKIKFIFNDSFIKI